MGLMAVHGLSDTEREALAYLALNREASRYMVEKGIGRAYSGVYGAIASLQEKALVQAVREEPNRRNPNITVEYYSLTLDGFYHALLLDPVLDNLERVSEAHGDKLPLILGKWSLYKGVEIELVRAPGYTLGRLIRNMLKISVKKNLALFSSDQMQWFREEFGREPRDEMEDVVLLDMYNFYHIEDYDGLEREIYTDVFFGRDLNGIWRHLPPIKYAFRKVASDDVDLRNFFRRAVKNRMLDLEAELEEMENP